MEYKALKRLKVILNQKSFTCWFWKQAAILQEGFRDSHVEKDCFSLMELSSLQSMISKKLLNYMEMNAASNLSELEDTIFPKQAYREYSPADPLAAI